MIARFRRTQRLPWVGWLLLQSVYGCLVDPDLYIRFNQLVRQRGNAGRASHIARVAALLYAAYMRSTTFPAIRIEPEVRAEVEAVLREGESLTQFIK